MPEKLRSLYDEGRHILEAVPLPDAALDARLLLEAACGADLQTLLAHPQQEVREEDALRYRRWIERRRLREPAAMILGEWDFMGLTFKVTKDTLIPEQDTEVLAETALELLSGKTTSQPAGSCAPAGGRPGAGSGGEDHGAEEAPARIAPIRILDLCTGTGCILLSLLHFLPEVSGIGTDISAPALSAAEENAARLGLAGRSLFCRGDLWEALPDPRERFDLIASNPPYVPTAVIGTLEPEVRCGEPILALDGGADGLDFYRRICGEAARHLKPGGVLIFESGFDEAADIRALMEAGGLEGIRVVKDYGGLDRVVLGRRILRDVREDGSGAAAL